MVGSVVFFNHKKGFGLITPVGPLHKHLEDVFVRAEDVLGDSSRFRHRARVEYDQEWTEHGPIAKNVREVR